ncbi:hypothetical protein [Selenomonas noxia]|uniref:hypothetical protein n=1 Tax=Selenomonas noxia TaxID=135083 RepID=UPI0028E9D1EF|nr:hypothetical protein [Selenomonas noxia]
MFSRKFLVHILILMLFLLAGTAHAEVALNPLLLELRASTFTDRGDALELVLPPGEFKSERKETGQQVFSCESFQGAYKDRTLTLRVTHIPFANPTGTAQYDPTSPKQLKKSVARYTKEHARPTGTQATRDETRTIDGRLARRLTQVRTEGDASQTIYDTLIILTDRGEWNIEAVYTSAPSEKELGESIDTIFTSASPGRVSIFSAPRTSK